MSYMGWLKEGREVKERRRGKKRSHCLGIFGGIILLVRLMCVRQTEKAGRRLWQILSMKVSIK